MESFDKNHEKFWDAQQLIEFMLHQLAMYSYVLVHIKIGNIFEQSLKEIIDHGFSIKYFRNHSNLCLAAKIRNLLKNS